MYEICYNLIGIDFIGRQKLHCPFKWVTMIKLITVWCFLLIHTAVVSEFLSGPGPQIKQNPISIAGLLKGYDSSCPKSLRSAAIENYCDAILNTHRSQDMEKRLLCYAYVDVVLKLCDKNLDKINIYADHVRVCDTLPSLYSTYTANSELQERVNVFRGILRDHEKCLSLCTVDKNATELCSFLVNANHNLHVIFVTDNIRHDTSNKQEAMKNGSQKNATRTNQSDQTNVSIQSHILPKPKSNVDREPGINQLNSSNEKPSQVVTNNCDINSKGVEACKPTDVEHNKEERTNPLVVNKNDMDPILENGKEKQYVAQDEEPEPENPLLNEEDTLIEPKNENSQKAPIEPQKDEMKPADKGVIYEVQAKDKPEPDDKLEENDNIYVGKVDQNADAQLVLPHDVDIDNESAGLHAQLDSNPFYGLKKEISVDYKDAQFVETEGSPLFAYVLGGMAICVLGYIVAHNKNKLLGCILEGRRSSGSRASRRRHTASYRKLDCNIEEAITSPGQSDFNQVIY